MAYVVEYGGQVPVEQAIRKGRKRKWVAAVCILLVVVAARVLLGDALLEILIPGGDDAATVQAFSNLLCGLGEGESVSDCMTAFCREVMYGAG